MWIGSFVDEPLFLNTMNKGSVAVEYDDGDPRSYIRAVLPSLPLPRKSLELYRAPVNAIFLRFIHSYFFPLICLLATRLQALVG